METQNAEEDKQMLPLYNLLPAEVRRKIRALKKLQYHATILEAKYFCDVHKLECKYASLHSEVYSKRANFIEGKEEPTNEECDFREEGYESPDENDKSLLDLRQKVANMYNFEGDEKGIPDFWLTVLKNAGKTFDLVRPHDEPVLKFLRDVQVSLQSEPMGFIIGFKFSPNPYFINRVLTKEYEMRCTVDDLSPWSFDGPEIIKAKGTQIDWKKGMDVTKRPAASEKEVKGTKDTRSDSDKIESFFNFFSPPQASDCQGERCGELHCKLAEDYALGIFLREKLIPNAVLYFTGDAFESDSSSESESESSEKSDIEEDYENSSSGEEDSPEKTE